MKIKKMMSFVLILCMLCLLWTAAGAAPVDIYSKAVRPYSWTMQEETGSEVDNIPYLLDGDRLTGFEHVGVNSIALDDIPDITFYFPGTSMTDIWVRNGWSNYRYEYTYHARVMIMDVTLWSGDRQLYSKRFTLEDNGDSSGFSRNMIDGYQRLNLKNKYENVTQVDLFIRGWYEGETRPYVTYMSDMIFLPDTVENIFGEDIFNRYDYDDGGYDYDYDYDYDYYPPSTPTPYNPPTPTPPPRYPDAQPKGLDIRTRDRIAARSGPGTQYTDLGSYLQNGAWVKALSSSYDSASGTWWIQVEMTYNGEQIRCYTEANRLYISPDQVQEEVPGIGGSTLKRSVYAYWGPGYGYAMYSDQVPAGTSGTVIQEEGAYAQFEFYDERIGQTRRVWVPASALEAGANG